MSLKNKAKENTVPLQQPASNRLAFPKNLNACGLLDQFKPQEGQGEEKKPKITTSKKQARLLEMFTQNCKAHARSRDYFEFLSSSKKLIGSMKISNEDIQSFIGTFSGNFTGRELFPEIGRFGGMFISALMEKCGETSLDLDVRPVPFLLSYFGFSNDKNVTVHGNLGHNSFQNLCSGTIILNGGVIEIAELMTSNDFLTINGDAYAIAKDMNNGNIILNGNLGIPSEKLKYPEANVFPNNAWYGSMRVSGNIYPKLQEQANMNLTLYQNGKKLMERGKVLFQPENK